MPKYLKREKTPNPQNIRLSHGTPDKKAIEVTLGNWGTKTNKEPLIKKPDAFTEEESVSFLLFSFHSK